MSISTLDIYIQLLPQWEPLLSLATNNKEFACMSQRLEHASLDHTNLLICISKQFINSVHAQTVFTRPLFWKRLGDEAIQQIRQQLDQMEFREWDCQCSTACFAYLSIPQTVCNWRHSLFGTYTHARLCCIYIVFPASVLKVAGVAILKAS